ncbi:hypothetical protein [uncultured Algibacter sp.]|jgi:hypothetical protein|uniref:hypothetical protein n=1 Tax=uncultured Algibacter sp. TaxID=298659 RepID=UPI00261B17A4|nr:hypothetical protein [uncultured Algibacter sp.]
MSKDNIDSLFKNLENDFDIENPDFGHESRFLQKLNTQKSITNHRSKNIWKPFLGIAASIALLVSLFVFSPKEDTKINLADISPEMAKTETLFMTSLKKELENLNSEDMPEYQEIIVDALFQIKILEEDYNQLILGLKEQPNNQLVLDAMILNFQSRINVIQDTKEKIEVLKKSNNQITII